VVKKCAFIRSDKSGKKCPFGLPIIDSCLHAGDSVSHMCPLDFVEDDRRKGQVEKANQRVYIYYKTGTRCLYAASVIKDKNAVNCDFGDTAAGLSMDKALSGSPLYAQTFGGVGLDGLYAFPLGFYNDNNESRNLFQGLFSLVGKKNMENGDIIKEAVSELPESTVLKLEENKKLTEDERQEVFSALEKCRQEYEDQRDDSGKMKDLADTWNPRKRL